MPDSPEEIVYLNKSPLPLFSCFLIVTAEHLHLCCVTDLNFLPNTRDLP